MDKIAVIDWEPILWVGGIFLMIISGLLGWIGLLLKAEKSNTKEALDKHENWILTLQAQVAESQKQTALAIQAIQIDQKQYQKQLEVFDKSIADSIIQKLGDISRNTGKKER